MLKLKKLQILGFKSFCDRTELKFHAGARRFETGFGAIRPDGLAPFLCRSDQESSNQEGTCLPFIVAGAVGRKQIPPLRLRALSE